MLSEENFPSSVAFLLLVLTFTSRFPVTLPCAVNLLSLIILYLATSSKGKFSVISFKFSF